MPRFTVVTPTYNRAGLLPKTIESVIRQTETDFEYIIIDDGSTDDTRQVVAPFLKDSRLQYVYQENGGEPAAINRGWEMAQGEYFVQINSDDPVLPDLLTEMGKALDSHPKAVLAYCDFQFVDENDRYIKKTCSPDWMFIEALKNFSCYAASPGTTYRRTALSHRQKLRPSNYKYINDIDSFWSIALEGDFLHVPLVLATWREHSGQISHNRYLAIPEIENWFQRYFANPDLSEEVKSCKAECRKSISRYYRLLLEQSKLTMKEKREKLFDADRIAHLRGMRYANLQVGDNDLIGNKFNGHDLHLMLQEQGVRACHIVLNKESKDPDTFPVRISSEHNYAMEIMHRKEFLLADIVHLHLIHNTNFDINLLPLFCSLKPTIITLHDPFFLSGHCIYNGDCDQNLTGCVDCEHLNVPFAIKENRTAFLYEQKRQAIQNAGISAIVASEWMEEKVAKSPIFQSKKVYRLPFGVDQSIFQPCDPQTARRKLGLPQNALVLMFRSDRSIFKGLDVIKSALNRLHSDAPVCLLTVGENGLLKEYANRYDIHEYGWIKDDRKLAVLYQACDLFLMPSKQEAFGMMAIEAMSCEKPVLTLEGTALPSVVHSPDCGLAVKTEEYTETLQRWIDQPQERAERGAKCLRYAREHYSRETYIQGMMEIYEDVMARFTPCANAQAVISETNWLCRDFSSESPAPAAKAPSRAALNMVAEPADEEVVEEKLYLSNSWRVTKPIRACQNARCHARGLSNRLAYYRQYMSDPSQDKQTNAIILKSHCWRITAPLRMLRRIVKRK